MSTLASPKTTEKKFGVVYTPKPVINTMLSRCSDMAGKKVCDPSCGDGEFLVAIAESIYKRLSKRETSRALNYTLKHLTGYDIDKKALEECRERLNDVAKRYKKKPPKWNLQIRDGLDFRPARKDSLKSDEGIDEFDIVIGNPPYVRIQHLEKSRRDKIYKGNWETITGCSDLFIVFFEIGFHLLREGGELVYITPNSWLKTMAGKKLRKHIRDNHAIKFLCDFGNLQVFDGFTTYSSIVAIEKNGKMKDRVLAYKCEAFNKDKPLRLKNGYSINTQDSEWSLHSKENVKFLNACNKYKNKLFEIADVNVGIQTLADNVFIVERGSVELEDEITRRIFKASVMKDGKDKIDRVIVYPYKDGKLIDEDKLASKYPKTYKHLLAHKKQLLARDKGQFNPDKWYAYGRDVAIVKGFGRKILTSSMNARPNFQKCEDENALFYSGYCIKPNENVNLDVLLKELNSRRMEQFIRLTSSPFQGGWYSYAKKYLQNFPVSSKVYV